MIVKGKDLKEPEEVKGLYWITMMVAGGFLVLWYLSRKEEAEEDAPHLLRPFYRMAMYLYKKGCARLIGVLPVAQVERDLQQLYPGQSKEYLKTMYYVKKGALSMAIVLAGTLFAAAVRFNARSAKIVGDDGTVVRGGYRDEAADINVRAQWGENRFDFRLSVEPLVLSGEELNALFDDFSERLPEYILGENDSLDNVTSDLILEERYDDFPIAVEWESDRPDLLGNAGYVAGVEAEEKVRLLAHLSHGGSCRTEELEVCLKPPFLTEEERLYGELQELLRQAQAGSAEQERWSLPAEYEGRSIRWTQAMEDDSLLVWAAAMVVAAAVYMLSDRDLHGRLEKRKESMRREYPDVVHRLILYVGAGLTLRGAFGKIAGDYEDVRKKGGRESPIYEEICYTCRELRSGVSEGASYEHFGRRTGLQEYVQLSALLMQNLKRGNASLLERLREAADKAGQERLQQGKRLGEEAGTKLLIPMVLMLAVVMVVIMIPAFSGM